MPTPHTEAARKYLQHPAFSEPHDGPPVRWGNGYQTDTYDPSPEQIAARCAAIQAAWSENERIGRMRSGSGESHIPHGISVTALGLSPCLDKFSCLGG